MISRLHLSTLLTIAMLISLLILFINGVYVNLNWIYTVSGTTMSISLILLLFDKFIWKWRFLHGWFIERPDLNGTWKVKIKSDWINPSTNEKTPELQAFMAIRQNYSNLSIRLMTPESNSELIGSSIQNSEDKIYKIFCIYRNEPNVEIRNRSHIHYGAMILNIEGDPPARLKGHYWTDRKTQGEVISEERIDKQCYGFEESKSAFNEKTAPEKRDEDT